MKKFARSQGVRKHGRSKRKGKKPSRKEQAEMKALAEVGHSAYAIAEILGRSKNTVAKYIKSPIFTDPKFKELVNEYKEKEILDLTSLNIEARARIHELIPEMTPIEAVATMDKSFQQRRLVEGNSTENIMSLAKIIREAHASNE